MENKVILVYKKKKIKTLPHSLAGKITTGGKGGARRGELAKKNPSEVAKDSCYEAFKIFKYAMEQIKF